ncbi:hypothetical protein C9374_002925 [Naegleria lovaniensis]|uniref:Uncharacterized protein n=1 Tax=Naegleria lovaniensis TaxID=51637 RepID=A0AA88GU00_NAELO|nr:uncharacterized protein C9374_002925 [Naegleria lovaniensis]KAG2385776.1 hypothetical protein C9374_002925 [Naegleria lovaniensis]
MNALKRYGNSLEEQVMQQLLDILANPTCYSSYNSYLGVFHYNDASQYWDLILKDSMLWIVVASCLSFYTLLLFRYRNSISLKRRLITPFIGPFCMMIICLVYIEPILMSLFKTIGRNIIPFIPVPNLFMSLLAASYMIVTIRFYFLRNLYQIRKGLEVLDDNKTNSSMKIYKGLTNTYVTLALIVVVTVLLFGAWFGIFYGIMESIIIERFARFEWTLQFDASLLALTTQFGFLSLVSILCLFVDAIFNLKKIRKHGIGYYFMFDDPFHLRMDIFSQLLIFLISILVVLDIFVWNTLIVNRVGILLFFLCSLMIFGGNVMLVEFISYLQYKRWLQRCCITLQDDDNHDALTHEWYENMKDIHFRDLQEQYATNLFALENLRLFEAFEKFEKKKNLSLNDLMTLNHVILSVNLSSDSKNTYNDLVAHLTLNPHETIPFNRLEPIKLELVAENIIPEIYLALKQTSYFAKWKEVTILQKEANIIGELPIEIEMQEL